MDCRTFHKNLEDYLEGGLDFPHRFGMERHVQQCISCGKQAADAQELRQQARGLKRVTAPPDFEASVLRRIQADKTRHWFWRIRSFWIYGLEWPSWQRMAAAGASLAVLALGAFVSVRWIRPDREPSAALSGISRPDDSAGMRKVSGRDQVPSNDMQLMEAPEFRMVTPESMADQSSQPGFVIEGSGTAVSAEYVEYLVPGTGERLLLPKTIRMRYSQPSEEHFVRNVSH